VTGASAHDRAGDRWDGVSVVICTYTAHRWDDFTAAADQVRAQLASGDELILVVDHNPELLARVVAAYPGAVVLPNEQKRGLSGARNTGLKAAAGQVTAFLDDDAIPEPGWVDAIRGHFASSEVMAVGGAVIPRWEGGRQPRWFPIEFGWVVGCDYLGLPGNGEEIRNPIGANMAIRRTAFDVVGGFSSLIGRVGTTPVGCEETDLCIRVRQALPEAVILRDTTAAVLHFVPSSRQTVRYFLSRCWHEGRSKAVLSGRVGRQDGLASERTYVRDVLLGGMVKHLAALRHGDVFGVARAVLIGAGALVTAAGFASVRR
jgi:glycosyltransferase involved in cell wall biosynthesis